VKTIQVFKTRMVSLTEPFKFPMKKLLLFDIDGTLVTGRGIPKKIILKIIHDRFPGFQNGHQVAFNGMTDPLIVQQVLAANNYKVGLDDPLIGSILDAFLAELENRVTPKSPPDVLPGVHELLQACEQDKDIFLGLVTGNAMRGAKIKLNAAGLNGYFPLGAFGSDHWDRNKLPPIAIERAAKYFGENFSGKNTWIIGDSPKDVQCAKTNNLKCLAVLTGKVEKKVMENAGADFVMNDRSDLATFFSVLNAGK
jgi:phosphoglycolate phosphatase-like HAD superfamily hydrolase